MWVTGLWLLEVIKGYWSRGWKFQVPMILLAVYLIIVGVAHTPSETLSGFVYGLMAGIILYLREIMSIGDFRSSLPPVLLEFE